MYTSKKNDLEWSGLQSQILKDLIVSYIIIVIILYYYSSIKIFKSMRSARYVELIIVNNIYYIINYYNTIISSI